MTLKRTAILRKTPMRRAGRLVRTAISRKPSVPQQRQQALRRTAYQIVDQRSGGQCELAVDATLNRCPNSATDHHHRQLRGMGGSTNPAKESPSAIIAACRTHHDAIHARPGLSIALGLIVSQSEVPASIPVTLHCGSVLLDNLGSSVLITSEWRNRP